MSTRRTGWALGAAGLAAGLALGVTGFANAADPSPSPSTTPDHQLKHRMDRHGPFGGRFEDHHLRGHGGLVTAIDSDSITVRTPEGSDTIALNSNTAYYVGKTKATHSAISKGDVVHVRVVDPRATKKVAAVVELLPAHLEGWVTKVDNDSFTITDLSGFTRTVGTSGSTTYVKDGATATRDAITVGTLVRALGTVDDDGTTLDATRVAVGTPDKLERMDHRDGPAGAPGDEATTVDPAGFPVA